MSESPKNEIDQISYALAMNLAASVMQIPLELNRQLIADVFRKLLSGGRPELEPGVYRAALQNLQAKIQAKSKGAEETASANEKEGKDFLKKNAEKEGVVVTPSGLQYLVLQEGEGQSPKASDVVKVHYEGKLISGTVFDSSIRRGEPIEFPLNQVIAGWTEGLQLMKPGAKYRFFIPSELAYGSRGAGGVIGPNATLIFDVELISFRSK